MIAAATNHVDLTAALVIGLFFFACLCLICAVAAYLVEKYAARLERQQPDFEAQGKERLGLDRRRRG